MPTLSQKNNTEILLMKKDLKYIRKEIAEIRDNHLAHLVADLQEFKKTVYLKLDSLKSTDDKGSLGQRLLEKGIEVVVLAVVIAILVVIGLKQ